MDNQQFPNNNNNNQYQAPQQPQYQNTQQYQAPQYQQPQYQQQAPQYQQPQYQQQAPQYQQPYGQPPMNQPGKNLAIASLVCGIASCVFFWFGVSAFISLAAGIAGIILAVNAKKQGFVGGMVTAGLVLSIVGTVIGGIVFASCVALLGSVGCVTSSLPMWY